jgi:hypothetical protein
MPFAGEAAVDSVVNAVSNHGCGGMFMAPICAAVTGAAASVMIFLS